MDVRRISHYEILDKLGEGGAGVVYKGRDTRLGRVVALKVLPARLLDSPQARRRFDNEARAISALNHPAIATIYEIAEDDGAPVLVLEYLSGGTLRSRIRVGRLPAAGIIAYAAQIADGLACAHRHGILHRDVKSENLLFTGEGVLKITDFGLARCHEGTVTLEGTISGTMAYLAPEYARGQRPDQRADIFSLGIVLYEMAAGEPPFRGEHVAALLHEIVHTPTPSLKPLRPDLPDGLDRIVQRATAKDRDRRYSSMEELAQDLRSLGDGGELKALEPAESWPTGSEKRWPATKSATRGSRADEGVRPTFYETSRAEGPSQTGHKKRWPAERACRVPLATVLVVEDEDDLRKGIEINLAREGFRVLTASNGQDAIRMAIEERLHLVVLDVMLPGMNGLDVCRELRRNGFSAPIMMLSARSEEIDRVVGLEIGANDYVTKPFSMRELLARIRAHLRHCHTPANEVLHRG